MKEIRIGEIRATNPVGKEKGLYIEGRAIVYDQPTTIKEAFGEYTEIIKRGALDGADLTDSRLLYNHDLSKIPLARKKTMQFMLSGRVNIKSRVTRYRRRPQRWQ